MKKSSLHKKLLISLAVILSACVFQVRPTPAQQSSSDDSKSVTVKQSVLNDCSKALDELSIFDKLLEAKQTEINLLNEKVNLLKDKFDLAVQLAESRKNEVASEKQAKDALNERLNATQAQLVNKDKEIAILKKRKTSILTIMKAVGIGIGIGVMLK